MHHRTSESPPASPAHDTRVARPGKMPDSDQITQQGSAPPALTPRERAFDMSGIERGTDGIARYVDRPESVVAMLRATVERYPDREALTELDGDRISFGELWERAARVAG